MAAMRINNVALLALGRLLCSRKRDGVLLVLFVWELSSFCNPQRAQLELFGPKKNKSQINAFHFLSPQHLCAAFFSEYFVQTDNPGQKFRLMFDQKVKHSRDNSSFF